MLGVVRPSLSPDGTKIAFSAIGDVYVMTIGGKPENLTRDAALDTEPAWSPDGSQLVYSSDRGSRLLQLWIRDMKTGQARQLTRLETQPMGAAWSPDGKRVVIVMVAPFSTRFREGTNQLLSISADGGDDKWWSPIQNLGIDSRGGCGPAWSPDGTRMAAVSSRARTRRTRPTSTAS